jgi:signal peptidase I
MTLLDGERLAAVATLWRREGKSFAAAFGGTSMMPTIAPGQPVVVECAAFEPSRGDVIAFVRGNQVIVHRVVAIRGSRVITRGDANRVVDLPVDAASILGRIVDIPPIRVPLHQAAGDAMLAMLGERAIRAAIALRRAMSVLRHGRTGRAIE